MNQELELEDDKKHQDFIITCRKVRLWMAKNPGSEKMQIKEGLKLDRVDGPLAYMYSMGLIRIEFSIAKDGRRVRKWYVVPQ